MKPLEMLIIRACKSKDAKKRLKSIYHRYHCHVFGDTITDLDLVYMMLPTIDKYFPMLPSQIISNTQPTPFFKEETWEERTLRVLINRIRFERVDLCPKEMIWPKCYRTVVEN